MSKSIGTQIAFYRKKLHMTQEELGKAVGVSMQAVSRWENGGMPDTELLPNIADALGTSIDALFGRNEEIPSDITEVLARWIHAMAPDEHVIQRFTRTLWEVVIRSLTTIKVPVEYSKYSLLNFSVPDKDALIRTVLSTNDGFVLGVSAEDMSFISFFPEPANGYYDDYLLPNDVYRKIFAALAEPGALELLMMFHNEKPCSYLSSVAAKHAGIPLEETERLLDILERADLLQKIDLLTEEGHSTAYVTSQDCGLIPLLLFTRWICKTYNAYLINWPMRSKPYFSTEQSKNETH